MNSCALLLDSLSGEFGLLSTPNEIKFSGHAVVIVVAHGVSFAGPGRFNHRLTRLCIAAGHVVLRIRESAVVESRLRQVLDKLQSQVAVHSVSLVGQQFSHYDASEAADTTRCALVAIRSDCRISGALLVNGAAASVLGSRPSRFNPGTLLQPRTWRHTCRLRLSQQQLNADINTSVPSNVEWLCEQLRAAVEASRQIQLITTGGLSRHPQNDPLLPMFPSPDAAHCIDPQALIQPVQWLHLPQLDACFSGCRTDSTPFRQILAWLDDVGQQDSASPNRRAA